MAGSGPDGGAREQGRSTGSRTSTFVVATAVLMLVVVASASAKRIAGTARNDVLRGTSAADVLDGRGGNDRLYGLAGDDRLIGGAGNDRLWAGAGVDRISCGGGQDIAYGDAEDTIAADCERRVVAPPAAIGSEHTPYLGTTAQGKRMGFDGAGTAFRNVALRFDAGCTGDVSRRLLHFCASFPSAFTVARPAL